MNDPIEEVRKLFGGSSHAEKSDAYEASMVAAVLRQIGVQPAEIKQYQHDFGAAFGWDWFNDLGYVRAKVGSVRVFEYRFIDLLLKPANHQIVQEFARLKGESLEPACLIFKVHDHGNWVATNLKTEEDTSLHVVTRDAKLNVLHMTDFFKNRWSIE